MLLSSESHSFFWYFFFQWKARIATAVGWDKKRCKLKISSPFVLITPTISASTVLVGLTCFVFFLESPLRGTPERLRGWCKTISKGTSKWHVQKCWWKTPTASYSHEGELWQTWRWKSGAWEKSMCEIGTGTRERIKKVFHFFLPDNWNGKCRSW